MKALTSEDWQLIHQFLIQVGSIDSFKEYKLKVLELIKPLIAYESSNFFVYTELNNQLKQPVSVNLDSQVIDDYINYFQYIDDLKEKTFNQPYPIKSTQVMDYKEWKRTEFFNDFLKINGCYYLCGVDLHYNNQLLGTLNFYRNEHSPDFNLKELLYLKLLRPHLSNQLYKLLVIEKEVKIKKADYSKLIETEGLLYKFSNREIEVAKLVASGLNNEEMADRLFISINTVKKHLYSIFRKMGVNSRAQLTSKLLKITFKS